MLGKVLMAMSDYEEALKEFQRLCELRPTSGDAHYMKAEAFRMLGENNKAIDEYELSLKVDPRRALAYAYLGECYRTKEDFRLAVRECKEAIKLDPDPLAPYRISPGFKVNGMLTKPKEVCQLMDAYKMDDLENQQHPVIFLKNNL